MTAAREEKAGGKSGWPSADNSNLNHRSLPL
jgi:hypothetical protein